MQGCSDDLGRIGDVLVGDQHAFAVFKHDLLMVRGRREYVVCAGYEHALLLAHLLLSPLLLLLFVALALSFVVLPSPVLSLQLLELRMSALVLRRAGVERCASHRAVAMALLLPLVALAASHGPAPLLGGTVLVGVVRRGAKSETVWRSGQHTGRIEERASGCEMRVGDVGGRQGCGQTLNGTHQTAPSTELRDAHGLSITGEKEALLVSSSQFDSMWKKGGDRYASVMVETESRSEKPASRM